MLYLARAIGRLEVATEEDLSTPVTEERTFAYVSDPALRAILSRDYGDVQRTYIGGSWKAAIILAGGLGTRLKSVVSDWMTSRGLEVKFIDRPVISVAKN